MKFLLVTGLLFATVYLAQAQIDRQKSIKVLKKCKAMTKASEDPEKVFDEQKIPESKEGKCMMACVLEEEKLMKNGQINPASAAEWFQKKYEHDTELLEKVAEVIGKCSLEDTKGKDKCESAYTYLKCGQRNGVKL